VQNDSIKAEFPPAEFLTKRGIAQRYQLSERSIDNLTAKAAMPVLRVSTRKLIFCVRDCDLWLKERFEVARRKPSTARLRVTNVPAATPTAEGGVP
jgi:hypothetical protein